MKYKHSGFSLLELMLVLVFIVAASAVAYKMFKPSQTQAAVRQEQQNVGRLVDGIMGAYSTANNFSTLSTATAAGVLNLPFSANGLNSAMKTDVTVRPATSNTSNDSFDLVYASLSPDKCIALIPALSSRSNAIFVGQRTQNLQNNRGEITDESLVAAQCGSSSSTSVTFRFRADKNTFASSSMDSCLCAPESETQTVACPANSAGSITQRRTGTCTGGTPSCPSLQWSSWVTASNTCGANAAPVTPTTPVAPVAPQTCVPSVETQTVACPAGQVGGVLQQRSRACPANTWGAWSNVSSSCQPDPNRPACTPRTQRQNASCPTGQGGQIVQERASTCDASGNEVWSNDWKNISSTCTASCVANGTCCMVSRQTSTDLQYCGAGNYGSIQRDLYRTSTCPSPTGAPVWSDNWGETRRNGSCTACPAPTQNQETQSVAASAACPAGQTGSHTWTSNQVRTRTQSYNCPDRTINLPAPTYSDWSGWTETSRSGESNTCAALPSNECAVPGSYTITSVSVVVRAGTSNRTINPYTFGQLQSTPGSSNNDNMEFEGTVTGVFNGSPFNGRVRASQNPTIRGTGNCYAMQGQGANAYLYSCGGGGMPPGLDLSVFMAGNSQGQMSITTRPCGGGGGSANITTGNLFVYSGVGFISTGNAPAGQTTMVASSSYRTYPSYGPLRASYANYSITFNGVTKTALSGSCSVSNMSAPQNCTQEQTVDFNGRSLVIKLVASAAVTATEIDANAQVYITPN